MKNCKVLKQIFFKVRKSILCLIRNWENSDKENAEKVKKKMAKKRWSTFGVDFASKDSEQVSLQYVIPASIV